MRSSSELVRLLSVSMMGLRHQPDDPGRHATLRETPAEPTMRRRAAFQKVRRRECPLGPSKEEGPPDTLPILHLTPLCTSCASPGPWRLEIPRKPFWEHHSHRKREPSPAPALGWPDHSTPSRSRFEMHAMTRQKESLLAQPGSRTVSGRTARHVGSEPGA
jgi:hypothetical protein